MLMEISPPLYMDEYLGSNHVSYPAPNTDATAALSEMCISTFLTHWFPLSE